ncbi:hypothetical protein, partial [Sphingomonas sp. LH128]|uniref:hypothetical protein n=1 Tax=Sphingomonas sp. LH128 TaxID=473781 RepID=UPI00155E8946
MTGRKLQMLSLRKFVRQSQYRDKRRQQYILATADHGRWEIARILFCGPEKTQDSPVFKENLEKWWPAADARGIHDRFFEFVERLETDRNLGADLPANLIAAMSAGRGGDPQHDHENLTGRWISPQRAITAVKPVRQSVGDACRSGKSAIPDRDVVRTRHLETPLTCKQGGRLSNVGATSDVQPTGIKGMLQFPCPQILARIETGRVRVCPVENS